MASRGSGAGVRGGCSLSPYLVIIVADILKQLIIKAYSGGLLSRPLQPDLLCPAQQYADATLIIVKATPLAAKNLKTILDQFADATGLAINFSESTLILLNVDRAAAITMVTDLATTTSFFAQMYLDLPLSPYKLKQIQPILDRCEFYLAGWCALLLS